MITRTSRPLEISRRRLERLKSISPVPDLANGFTIADFESKINAVAALEAQYNEARSELDAKRTTLKKSERELLDFRERILTAIAFIYGKDSEEYVAAGGVRKSERKKPRPRNISSTQDTESVM